MNVTMPSQRVQDLLRKMEPAHRETLIAILQSWLQDTKESKAEAMRMIYAADEETTEVLYEVFKAAFEDHVAAEAARQM